MRKFVRIALLLLLFLGVPFFLPLSDGLLNVIERGEIISYWEKHNISFLVNKKREVFDIVLYPSREKGARKELPKQNRPGQNEIVPEIGAGKVCFGDSESEVVKALGNPRNRLETGKSVHLWYHHMEVVLENDLVQLIALATAFPGKTEEGIGIGSKKEEIIRVYGKHGPPQKLRFHIFRELSRIAWKSLFVAFPLWFIFYGFSGRKRYFLIPLGCYVGHFLGILFVDSFTIFLPSEFHRFPTIFFHLPFFLQDFFKDIPRWKVVCSYFTAALGGAIYSFIIFVKQKQKRKRKTILFNLFLAFLFICLTGLLLERILWGSRPFSITLQLYPLIFPFVIYGCFLLIEKYLEGGREFLEGKADGRLNYAILFIVLSLFVVVLVVIGIFHPVTSQYS